MGEQRPDADQPPGVLPSGCVPLWESPEPHAVLSFVEGIGVIKSYNLLGEKSEELSGNFKRSRNTSLDFEQKMTPWTMGLNILYGIGIAAIFGLSIVLEQSGVLSLASGIQFFMKFLEVKGYIKKVPFYASYYLEKQIPVHHDRSVEEDVYMEIIQNLSQFPEHLRMMFLHLWCVGLRISEVCTLKGDAYYIQNGDCWMKVYQVKMKNYKRVPIPVTLYRLMQVYLKKHPTKKEAYIFRNRKGGAFSKSTFMGQMKKYCSQIGIQNGEYIFKSHDYRHTVATNFYEHGVSIQSIRDYLGHTFEKMTMQYIDYMPRKIAKENDAYFEEEENSLLACMQKGEKHG